MAPAAMCNVVQESSFRKESSLGMLSAAVEPSVGFHRCSRCVTTAFTATVWASGGTPPARCAGTARSRQPRRRSARCAAAPATCGSASSAATWAAGATTGRMPRTTGRRAATAMPWSYDINGCLLPSLVLPNRYDFVDLCRSVDHRDRVCPVSYAAGGVRRGVGLGLCRRQLRASAGAVQDGRQAGGGAVPGAPRRRRRLL